MPAEPRAVFGNRLIALLPRVHAARGAISARIKIFVNYYPADSSYVLSPLDQTEIAPPWVSIDKGSRMKIERHPDDVRRAAAAHAESLPVCGSHY